MEIRFAGSGDAFGSGGRLQTCIHLADREQVMLVDCGATSLVALKAQRPLVGRGLAGLGAQRDGPAGA